MLKHHQVQGVFWAILAATGLLLTSCTHDPVEPAPVSIRGVNKTMNSTAPMVAAPLAPPQSATASAIRAAPSSIAHRPTPTEHASGGAVITAKRSASAQKVHRPRVLPQMAGAVGGKAKAHHAAKSAGSATALARSHSESIPLDEPVTKSAEQTNPAWVQPAPAEAPQQQLRPSAP
jgi:hypothetical protein